MLILAVTSFVMISIFAAIYSSYYVFILRRKGNISNFLYKISSLQNSGCKSDSNLENVSIIVSTYNEAKIIDRKINNISQLNYPLEKLEVIIYDDASIDGTCQLAEKKLKEKMLSGKVIHNVSRLGLNRCINDALSLTKNSIICITDSDVLLEKNSLRNSMSVLQQFENVGGVTGRVKPVFAGEGVAQRSESTYRGFYHDSMLAESSIHSAFPGNGPFILYNKSKVPLPIPNDYGSTDGNIAINVIKQGFRFIYIPNAIVFEPSPETLRQHRLQKIRRAKRLLQVFMRNRDIYGNKKYGEFGRRVFPIKLLMFGLCPPLLFIGLFLIAFYVVLSKDILLYALTGILLLSTVALSVAFKRLGSILSSFILHQFYLLVGLALSFTKSKYWNRIERKTNLSF